MADKQKVAIICITLLLSSILSTFVIPLDKSVLLDVELENPNLVQFTQGNNTTMDIGNFSKGGYHLSTGEWWSDSSIIPIISSVNDADGDGVNNTMDPFPLNINRHSLGSTLPGCQDVPNAECKFGGSEARLSKLSVLMSNSSSIGKYLDIDADGIGELIIHNKTYRFDWNNETLTELVTLPTTIQYSTCWSNPELPSTTHWFDYQNDGDLDFIESFQPRCPDDQIFRIHLNDGFGNFSNQVNITWEKTARIGNAYNWGSVWFLPDYNGDLLPELASREPYYNNQTQQQDIRTFVIISDNGTWNNSNWIETNETLPSMSFDINGDGLDDFVTGGGMYPHYTSVRLSEDGSTPLFTNSSSIITNLSGSSHNYFDIIDIDGDGDMEVLFNVYEQYSTVSQQFVGYIDYYENGSATKLDSIVGSKVDCPVYSIGDLTGDGMDDIICAGELNTAGIYELYIIKTHKDRIPVLDDWGFILNDPATSLEIDDVNQDGISDIRYTTAFGLYVIFGGGLMINSSADDEFVDPYSSPNNLMDCDYDASPDFFVHDGAFWAPREINGRNLQTLWGPACGLPDENNYEFRNSHWIGDVNADGFEEVLSSERYSGGFEIFTFANFSTQQNYNTGHQVGNLSNYSGHVAATNANIDGIGADEFITLNYTEDNGQWALARYFIWSFKLVNDSIIYDSVSMINLSSINLPNNGGANMGRTGIIAMKSADFDNDGDDDILIVSNYGISYHRSVNGSIESNSVWNMTYNITTYGTLSSVRVDDIDNDGLIDFIIGFSETHGYQYNSSIIFLNRNAGLNYQQVNLYKSSSGSNTFRLFDFNGDGIKDIFEGTSNFDYIHCGINSTTYYVCWKSMDQKSTIVSYILDTNQDGIYEFVRFGEVSRVHEFSIDIDGDWIADEFDDYPLDPTQSSDFDNDNFGDNPLGRLSDSCVGNWGDSWRDRWGCPDLDKDGQSDLYDDFINKPSQWIDSDGDGLGDNWGDVSINATRPTYWPGQWLDSAYNPDPSPLDFDNDGKEDEGLNGSQGPFDACPYTYGTSTIDRVGCIDSDSDGFSDPDSNWGVLDGADNFPAEQTQWNDSDGDGFGDNQAGKDADAYPDDPTQWADFDGDGHGDNPNGTNADAFSFEPTQWDDRDGDGYGDNPSPAFQPDACTDIAGTSTRDGYGCLDADGDGWGLTDDCPEDAGNSTVDRTGCIDIDGDGWSSVEDYDQDDPNVWSNLDGDEYPDQGNSTTLDSCPSEFGTSWLDRLGCADPDGDGWSSADGVWFIHPLGSADSHPTDASQWRDRDGDGYGDNQTGSNPDACPDLNGESKWNIVDGLRVSMLGCADADGDGYTDDIDNCLIIAGSSQGLTWGCPDSDDDGTQDLDDDCPSQLGTSTANLKACPDSDNDGIADLEDPFPLTPLLNNATSTDWDGDGYANANDSFVFDETQWNDTDGDGLGDEPTGNSPDPYPNDRDNDAWDDPNDLTTDDQGCLEKPESGKDAFPTDKREWLDSDGDCIGNNADSDDDNDGYSDNAELQAGTDPLSADSKPTESFEIVVPGTSIGLGAWDLIGMFGGIPLFAWLAFGFVTRNRRAGKFEDQLRQAKSRDELEQIALRSEYSLMLRLIGPHQGIRLERLRAELDDVLESVQRPLDPMDQTSIVEASMSSGQELKSITPLPDEGPSLFATGITDEDGYEWLDHNGLQYYRSAGSDVGWNKWEN